MPLAGRKDAIGQGRSVLLALAAAMLAAALASSGVWADPADVAGTITGFVFRDYNANGVQDAAEPGAGGVKVTAYNVLGSPCGSTTSGPGGAYTLVHSCTTATVRLEFTILPSWAKSGSEGQHSGTSVQFVPAGTSDARFGINNPADYCQEDPYLCTSIAQLGNQISGDYKAETTLASARNDWGTNKGRKASDWQVPDPPVEIAVAKETGTIYGLAWRPGTKTLYAAAYFKQFAGFGPAGAGAIYRVAVNTVTGGGSSAPALFVDVNSYPGVDVSCPAHDTDLDWPKPTGNDARWDAVGKCSLGDLEISDDGKALYALDLKGRQVLAISADTGALLAKWPVPTVGLPIYGGGTCAAGDVRPLGLGFKDGALYVGAVCSAQSSVSGTNNGEPGGLHAYVWAVNTGTGKYSLVLEYQIVADRDWWNPWKSTQAQAKAHAVGLPGWAAHSQPMLADIEFFGDDLTLGFRDRFGDQWGSSYDYYVLGDGNGDIKCASWDAGSSRYVMEADGICGSRRAKDAPPGPGLGDGPGSEFYWGDGHNKTLGSGNEYEDEFSMGALAQFGTEPLAATQIDLSISFGYTIYDVGGIIWHDNLEGGPQRGYAVYSSAVDRGTFRKSNGLGDLEALCEPAPIEIGNRVWEDADWDGLQDPGETGLDGVTVELWTGTTKVGEAVTAEGGQYYFGGVEQRSMLGCASAQASSGAGTCDVQPGQSYEIRILLDDPDVGGRIPTVAGRGTDLHDSDCAGGRPGNGYARIGLTTGGPGANDHTFDCGLLELHLQHLPLILRRH